MTRRAIGPTAGRDNTRTRELNIPPCCLNDLLYDCWYVPRVNKVREEKAGRKSSTIEIEPGTSCSSDGCPNHDSNACTKLLIVNTASPMHALLNVLHRLLSQKVIVPPHFAHIVSPNTNQIAVTNFAVMPLSMRGHASHGTALLVLKVAVAMSATEQSRFIWCQQAPLTGIVKALIQAVHPPRFELDFSNLQYFLA